MATTAKVAVWPAVTDTFAGCIVICGAVPFVVPVPGAPDEQAVSDTATNRAQAAKARDSWYRFPFPGASIVMTKC